MNREEETEIKIGGKYIKGKRIGGGAFGEVFAGNFSLVKAIGINAETKQEVAIKFENIGKKFNQLAYEAKICKQLQGGVGIPKFYWFGEEGDRYAMVVELLGASLEDLRTACGDHFSLSTTLYLADQMLNRVEYFHNSNFIHRDVKPENFAMGIGENSSLLYIFDYGLAKKYRDPQTCMHIPYRDNKRLTGTARYASLFTHLGIEQSRRDDMECLGYTFVYLLKGELPWQGIQAENRHEKYGIIKEKKQSMKIEEICKDLPVQFARYLYYCRSLKFEDKPDYAQLKKMFKDLFYEKQYDSNFAYDWVLLRALASVERADSFSLEATNFAECPARKCNKLINKGSEFKVTEISTPKTIYPPQPFCSNRSATQPLASNKDHLRGRDKTVLFEIDNPVEENKLGNKSIEPEPEKEWIPRRPSTLNKVFPQPQVFMINPFESSSCDFNEHDIIEDSEPLEDGIPDEKPFPQVIKIPLSTYINNARHWNKYRNPDQRRKRSHTEVFKTDISGTVTAAKDWSSGSFIIGKG